MVTLAVFLGVLAALSGMLVGILLRRGGRPTLNADGLRIEQARRERAARDRKTYNAFTQHSGTPAASDDHGN
ncbi:hypothetical protein AB0C59_09835 [Streptomyces sp. NPDC048664]|uniref:hypothetical protein n=1 Tax=Streptomyces sp. NPDC048664 TaxID=3154505 RepID=UPI00342E90BA